MSQARTHTIVVGVDGSDRSVDALVWAATHARASGSTVRIVTAWHFPEVLDHRPARAESDLSADLEELLDGLVDQTCWDVRHEVVIQEDDPADLVLREGKEADLIVLGGPVPARRTHHPTVTGSVLEHAICPVVVVPAGFASDQ
jgi:nucleotide-binding universal stress UspA family protein